MSDLSSFYIVIMNLWVYGLLATWTLLGVSLSPLVSGYLWLRYRWSSDRIVRHLIWLYGRGWLMLIAPFVDFERQGLAAEDLPDGCVFVINHLSFFDTYFMGGLPHSDITFAVRSWPFKMFWYRFFMRMANYLEVEDQSWQQTTEQGTNILKKGGSVLFFPEGHRSRDGQLQRFYSGAFQLAVASGRPVVPLCITGTGTLLPPERKSLRPATVRLRILPPVTVESFQHEGGHIQLRKQVKELMAQTLAEMKQSPQAAAASGE